jgi:glutathione reductase (NADPH)
MGSIATAYRGRDSGRLSTSEQAGISHFRRERRSFRHRQVTERALSRKALKAGLHADRTENEAISMTMEQFDVVILGGGNAGIGVTGPVRRAGLSVAMIEARDLGGTCPNRGCTPKKILVAAGHALHEIERAGIHKIAVGMPKLDWAALIDREKEMIKDIPDNLARVMERRQVKVIRGEAAFAGPDTIRVGDSMLKARYIVIATGSKPRPLPFPGAEHMITSDEMLSERELPASVLFIGGGVISLEFGHVYARAGAGVTILEALPQLLPAMDTEAVAHLAAESERIGIRVKTAVTVKRIEPANRRLRVIFMHEGVEHAAEADRIVNGAGRIANVDTLDLASGNVDQANGRVSVDRYLRSTSNPLVHVCGDALPISPQLSPLATYEGEIVGRNIVEGPKHCPDYEGMATSVYTVPALAAVGLTEAAARGKGFDVEVHANDMLGWFSAKTYAETVAWSKIIVDNATDRILGAHFVGHEGQELINVFGLAIKFGITARQLRDNVCAYPTFSADIKHMFGHA